MKYHCLSVCIMTETVIPLVSVVQQFNIILYHLMFCIVLYCALTVIAKLNRFQNYIWTTLSEFWA